MFFEGVYCYLFAGIPMFDFTFIQWCNLQNLKNPLPFLTTHSSAGVMFLTLNQLHYLLLEIQLPSACGNHLYKYWQMFIFFLLTNFSLHFSQNSRLFLMLPKRKTVCCLTLQHVQWYIAYCISDFLSKYTLAFTVYTAYIHAYTTAPTSI